LRQDQQIGGGDLLSSFITSETTAESADGGETIGITVGSGATLGDIFGRFFGRFAGLLRFILLFRLGNGSGILFGCFLGFSNATLRPIMIRRTTTNREDVIILAVPPVESFDSPVEETLN
jgi:hypothetical protein